MRVQFSAGADRLTWAYPQLSPQLKKCAAYILEHPSEVATLSMRQVAARANVPPSTMNRLAKALDFRTYDDFRALYRDSINDQSAAYPLSAGQVQAVARESEFDHALSAFQQASLSNINSLFDHIDREALERAVVSLKGARNVLVAGMHASQSFANYMHHAAAMGFRNWHLLARQNGAFFYLLEDLTPADVVVCIAIEPCAADTVRIARRGREAGARVIGITDRRTSPLAACSDDILLTPVQSPGLFPSYVATAALIEVLAGMVVARGGSRAATNIDKVERYRREMGEYWEA